MRLMRFVFTAAGLALTLASPAFAETAKKPVSINTEPATLGFSVGYFDVKENTPRNEAVDFRVEYRSDFDMLRLVNAQNSYVTIRPFGGVEATSDKALYGLGGFVFDALIGKWIVVSPSVGVGLYHDGDGKNMGSFIEFRSTMEAGVRFEDASRLTVSYGHISNAKITATNPGSEILSLNYHMPVERIFGK